MTVTIECKQCGGAMQQAKRSTGNAPGIALALVVLAVGIVLSVSGYWLIGVPVAVGALFMGGKRSKIWKCAKCGYYFERA